jgi:hypothetical protein
LDDATCHAHWQVRARLNTMNDELTSCHKMAKLPRFTESFAAKDDVDDVRDVTFGLGWTKRPTASGVHQHWTPHAGEFTTNPLLSL